MSRVSIGSGNRHLALACGLIAVLGVGVFAVGASGKKLQTRSESTSVDPLDFDSVTADCDPGAKAVSGGFRTELDPDSGPIFLPFESQRTGARGWAFSATYIFGPDPATITSFAYCRDEKVKSSAESETFDVGESQTVVATCPPGTKVLSGGFEGDEEDDAVPYVSRKLGKRQWEVTAVVYSDGASLTAQVNCREGRKLRKKEDTATIDDDRTATAVAKCKRSQRVVSGGFAQEDFPVEGGPFTYESVKDGKRKWRVSATSLGSSDITAYAYCEKKKKR